MGQLFSRIGTAHLVALGKIPANFSLLEDELCRLIWYLLGPDEPTWRQPAGPAAG